MDLSRIVWYLLFPTNLENLEYSISGGYKRRVLGDPRTSLFKWVDVRVIHRENTTHSELQLRVGNNNDIPDLIRQIKEVTK